MTRAMVEIESPLGPAAFAEHLPHAVAAAERHGHDLALVVVRALTGSRRGAARLEAALQRAPAFAYALQPGGYALLMPGATLAEAYDAAVSLFDRARGGILVRGALVHAGAAAHEPGMDAEALFAAAAEALGAAEGTGQPACIAARTPYRAAVAAR